MSKPELVHTSTNGGTIHKFPVPGGKREFTRFLSCFMGSCKFCNDMDEASAHLKASEVLHRADI